MTDKGSIASRALIGGSDQLIQAMRVATGSILTGIRTGVTVTWPQAFADTNYTVVALMSDASALGLGLICERVQSITNSNCVIQCFNASLGTLSGTIHVIGIHD